MADRHAATPAELPPDGAEVAPALDDGAVVALGDGIDTSRVEYQRAAG